MLKLKLILLCARTKAGLGLYFKLGTLKESKINFETGDLLQLKD